MYGSSPHLASEVEQSKPSKAPKAPKAKRPPVKAGGMGAKILAAMNSAKKVQLKSSEEKGDFDTNHLTASIDMQATGLYLLVKIKHMLIIFFLHVPFVL